MAKAHSLMTMKQLKDYIREKGLNDKPIKLSQNKAGLIADLKKLGHLGFIIVSESTIAT